MPDRVPITPALADKMKRAREAQSISQSELATRVKVPRARIKRIECHELGTLEANEYGRLMVALGITKRRVRKPSTKTKDGKKMRVRAARAVLAENGLLDVTLGELLRA